VNRNDFFKILSLPVMERYKYFIEKVTNLEELWGLYDDGWAMFTNKENQRFIPFWPKKIFAEMCTSDFGKEYRPEPIDIYNFVDNWLLELKSKNINPAIFYTPNKSFMAVDINKLINDLNSELYIYK
jgi:hypothetical protein